MGRRARELRLGLVTLTLSAGAWAQGTAPEPPLTGNPAPMPGTAPPGAAPPAPAQPAPEQPPPPVAQPHPAQPYPAQPPGAYPAQPPPAGAQPGQPVAGYPAPPPPGQAPLPPTFDEDLESPDDLKVFSLTFSPLHLVLPLFELQGEIRVTPGFGISFIGGAGKTEATTVDPDTTLPETTEFGIYELGAQFAWYPTKSFDGWQVGAEVLYVYIDAEITEQISGTAAGVGIGPFGGYKIMTDVGFTFQPQLGFQYVFASAKVRSDDGSSASGSTDGVVVLLNLNLGWSF